MDNKWAESLQDDKAPLTSKESYILKLFVAGHTIYSIQALILVQEICQEYLKGCFELQVIDIYSQPLGLYKIDMMAIPTLLREKPIPSKKLIGSITSKDNVMTLLDLNK